MQEVRRAYRENFYTADIGSSISGAILFKETLYQHSSDNVPFVTCLSDSGVLPGIKVDQVQSTTFSESTTLDSNRAPSMWLARQKFYPKAMAVSGRYSTVLKGDLTQFLWPGLGTVAGFDW